MKRPLTITIVHEVSYVKKPVYEYQDFAERLAQRGHNVTVIDLDILNATPASESSISRTGLGEIRLLSTPHSNRRFIKFIESVFTFSKLFRHHCRKVKPDIVLLYSVSITGLPAVIICKALGIPFVFRAIDIYHQLYPTQIGRFILKTCESIAYKYANAIISTNSRMNSYVQNYLRDLNSLKKCTIIDHGVDCHHFKKEHNTIQTKRNLNITDNETVVVFLGTTYDFAQLPQVIDKTLRTAKTSIIKFLIIGAGESDEALRELIFANDYFDKVVLTGMKDYNELPALLSVSDIAICPFSINNITRDIIPIKILQYLASGLPTICTPMPDVVSKFPSMESGIIFTKDDSEEEFSKTIIELANNKASQNSLSNNARNYALSNLSIQNTISNLETILYQNAAINR